MAPPHVEERMEPRKLIAFFAMVLGMFMSILDIQIVSASLAEIQAGLSAGSDEIGWVQTAYLIAEVIMIPLSGTLARIISTRYLFAISAAGFTLSSALFALATGERVTKAMQAVLDKARRYPPAAIQRAIRRAAAVDRAIKGVDAVEPWEEFAKLGLELHAS